MSSASGMRLPPLLGFACILSSYLFVITPLTIYLGNIDEFMLAIETLLEHFAIPAICLVGALIFIGYLLPRSFFDRYITLIATLSILLWIQGYVFVWDYGPLDGRSIDWNTGRWRGMVDLAAWALLLASALFLPRKATRLLARFAVALFLIQAASTVVAIYQSGEELRSKPAEMAPRDGELEMYRFSAEKNVLQENT